jgi:hypothetical protein
LPRAWRYGIAPQAGTAMSEQEFTNISLVVCLTGLMALMGFIIWDLGKKSGAGRFGMVMLFLVLGFGVVGFVLKNVLIEFMTFK